MSGFQGLFGPLISLFAIAKGTEAVVTQEPPMSSAAPLQPKEEDDSWRSRVSSTPPASMSMDM